MTSTQSITVSVGGTTFTATVPSPLVLTPAGSTSPPATGTGTTPAATAPFPAALAGHALLEQHLPADLMAWQFEEDGKTPVTNGSGVSADPSSPRNVSVATDGGLTVLKLAATSAKDCGVIQSPSTYPTSSGVIEFLAKFSGNGKGSFAAWASTWLYGDPWPASGEIDAVETQYGNSYVAYHYGSGGGSEATTDPWAYAGKTVQLTPKNSSGNVPAKPNILPDAWTHVTLAFSKGRVDVYYEGVLYCTISGSFVTGKPMYITAGIEFGAGQLDSANQAPFDVPASLELQYVRVFS